MARVTANRNSPHKETKAAMRKKSREETGASKWRTVISMTAVISVLIIALSAARPAAHPKLAAATVDETLGVEAASGLGPEVMQGQFPVLQRLIAMLQEVEAVDKTTKPEERLAAVRRMEEELQDIEAKIDSSTPTGKQQAGIVALVRSALEADQGNDEDWNWTDSEVQAKTGLVTYASKSYWDEAYTGHKYGEVHEWYGGWADLDTNNNTLSSLLRPLILPSSRVMMLGCGNSNMSVDMYREGYQSTVNIDWSEAVIERMRSMYANLDGLEWHAMDATAMNFSAGSFDTVIEKGLLDALFAGTGHQAPSVLREVHRVLRPGGTFFIISHSETRAADLLAKVSEAENEVDGEQALPKLASAFTCNLHGSLKFSAIANSTRIAHVIACERSA